MSGPARLPFVTEAGGDPTLTEIFEVFSSQDRPVPELYQLLANAPQMLRAWTGIAWPLRNDAECPRRLRELIILRIAQLTDASYEWESHLGFAERHGVRPTQVDALRDWQTSAEFDDRERALLQLADQLTLCGDLPYASFEPLTRHFSDSEIVEVILTAAFYCCVSRVLKAVALEATP